MARVSPAELRSYGSDMECLITRNTLWMVALLATKRDYSRLNLFS